MTTVSYHESVFCLENMCVCTHTVYIAFFLPGNKQICISVIYLGCLLWITGIISYESSFCLDFSGYKCV